MGLNDEVGIELLVDFIENEGSAYIAKIVAAGYGVCTMDNFPKVLVKCNEYNQSYRWAKFYLELIDSSEYAFLTTAIDTVVYLGTAGDECLHCLRVLAQIVMEVVKDLGPLIRINVVPLNEVKEEPKTDEPSEAELRAMLEAIKRKLGEA